MDKDIEILQTKLEYFEACVAQLRDEIPSYILKKRNDDLNRLSNVLRSVASLEADSRLQNALFNCAQKYENISNHQEGYEKCLNYTKNSIQSAKDMMIVPLRNIIDDAQSSQKAIMSGKKIKSAEKDAIEYSKRVIPLYNVLFDKHRISRVKKLLLVLLTTELRFHCKAIEELSDAITQFSAIPDDDTVQS